MKNIKNIYLILFVSLISLSSCNDFGDINEDPNNPKTLATNALLSGAERSISGIVASGTPNLYVQYLSGGQYSGQSRYQTLNFDYAGIYTDPLRNLNTIIKINTDASTKNLPSTLKNGSNSNQIAVAKILRAYFFNIITDRWGMAPYKEALKGVLGEDANIYPKYDTQETIYRGIFEDLDSAIAMINTSELAPTGDYLLSGNMTMWKKFANSLKLVYALRLSRKNTDLNDLAKNMFSEAFDSGMLITDFNDNVVYKYLTDDLNDNPWQDRFETRKDYLISEVFMSALVGSGSASTPEDPRTSKYSDPSTASGTFVGAPYGARNSRTANYSFITGNIITKNDHPLAILTASQINFSLAEGVVNGWISGDASTFYKKGIEESMKQWGVTSSEASTYVSANSYSGIADIAKQKWIALYLQGYESWAEWRRFNAMGVAPVLDTSFSHLNGADNEIIQRQAYAATAEAVNKENYIEAINIQGPDKLETKIWWAK